MHIMSKPNYQKDNIAQIKTFGIIDDSFRASKWITNIRSVYTTKKIEVVDLSDNSYRIDLNNIHLLLIILIMKREDSFCIEYLEDYQRINL